MLKPKHFRVTLEYVSSLSWMFWIRNTFYVILHSYGEVFKERGGNSVRSWFGILVLMPFFSSVGFPYVVWWMRTEIIKDVSKGKDLEVYGKTNIEYIQVWVNLTQN